MMVFTYVIFANVESRQQQGYVINRLHLVLPRDEFELYYIYDL